MKKIQLYGKYGIGLFAIVDDSDFEKVSAFRWTYTKVSKNKKYVVSAVKGKFTYLHRFIMDAPKGKSVDHINNDSLDNRRSNMRLCSIMENTQNSGKYNTNTTGYKGVCEAYPGVFIAQIFFKSKPHYLGRFKTKEAAALAYNKKAVELHGEFAHLNEVSK